MRTLNRVQVRPLPVFCLALTKCGADMQCGEEVWCWHRGTVWFLPVDLLWTGFDCRQRLYKLS